MQAIQTKYIGPANVRGSRVKATASAGSVTLHWDNSLNSEDNHKAAAMALIVKFGWQSDRDYKDCGAWYGAQLPDASYVWVEANMRFNPIIGSRETLGMVAA